MSSLRDFLDQQAAKRPNANTSEKKDTTVNDTTTIKKYDRSAQYEALDQEQLTRFWAGGNITGLPLQCEYCDVLAAWVVITNRGSGARVSCRDMQHIAYVESNGSQVFPEDVAHIAFSLTIDASVIDELIATATAVADALEGLTFSEIPEEDGWTAVRHQRLHEAAVFLAAATIPFRK